MPVWFRDAVDDDVGPLAALTHPGGVDRAATRAVADVLREVDRTAGAYLLVAEVEGRLVAALHLVTSRVLGDAGGRRAAIDRLVVADDVAGGPIPDELVDRAVERARELGCDRIRLDDPDDSEELRRVGAQHGFTTPHHGLERPLAAAM